MRRDVKHNYAFISYSHQDAKVAKWLQKKLESFKLPTEIHNEFEDSKYLRPIIRDKTDFDTGILSDRIVEHLSQSKYLIVICSLNSAKSDWVSREVQAFIDWGRIEYIIPFVIEGVPYSGEDTECLPQALIDHVAANPDHELLAVSIPEVGREKAYVRVVSHMLGVSFDALWKRHERERRRKIAFCSIAALCAATAFYLGAIPVSLTISITDTIHKLPMPENGLLTVNGAEYTIHSFDTTITIRDYPGYFRGQRIELAFMADYYEKVSSKPRITMGTKQLLKIDLKRDSTFAIFAGTVVDEDDIPVQGAEVIIGDQQTSTDANGQFQIVFPVAQQSEYKPIRISKTLYHDIFREDECPSNNLKYIIHPK